jgi:enoyl-CoA hydratase/carnithine racemase
MEELEFSDDGIVRRITLNRPEKRNALTRDMFAALTAAFRREPPPSERVTVLGANGPMFCAGVDLSQRATGDDAEGQSPLEQLCAAIAEYPLPVVAAVQGSAIGGGFMIALHCDVVIASSEAKLGNSSVQLGISPPWPMSRRVRAMAGPALAREILLLGDLLPAERLDRAHVVIAESEAAFDDQVRRVVERFAQNAPLSLRAIKATLAAPAAAEADHAAVTAMVKRAQASEDGKEGVLARRERREPHFVGR